jgi:hypothetical protein
MSAPYNEQMQPTTIKAAAWNGCAAFNFTATSLSSVTVVLMGEAL